MRTEKEIRQELKDLFEEDEALFNETIEELDSYNGYLGDDRYYYMEDLTSYIDTSDLWNSLIYRIFYGRDDDCYITNSQGEKEYSQFNPNRDYYYYDGYGNLVSTDYKDYSDYLDDYFIDSLLENRSYLNIDTDIEALLDELENAEQGEEFNYDR